jgi:hypothetical protein
MTIPDDEIMELLSGVYHNDKTFYNYGEKRQLDDKDPKPGVRWATPREIVNRFMQDHRIKISEAKDVK